jgi:hypothetical protein
MSKALIFSKQPLLTKKEVKTLAKAGIDVKTLSKFKESQWKKTGGEFDIVVVDDGLFNGDMHQACNRVRECSEAIIILLGDIPSWKMWDKAGEIGFDHYCKKPINPVDLERRMKLTQSELEYRQFREKLNRSVQKRTAITGAGAEGPAQDAGNSQEEPAPATGPVTEQDSGLMQVTEVRTINEDMAKSEPVPSVDPSPEPVPETAAPANNTLNIWQDAKVARLIAALLNGKIDQMKPEIDLKLEDGFAYHEADRIMETSGRETSMILESLVKEGLLLSEEYEKILVSPTGSVQLIPVERCPSCDSSQLTRGQLVEHFSCGYIGPEEEFIKGMSQVCPKCKRELKLIGTDYRKPGARYVCNNCNGVFPAPVVKCRCLRTGEFYLLEELRHVSLNSYRLNDAYKKKLEFELEPKRQLVEYLTRLGYQVEESVQVQGRSGASHTLDIQASMHGLITKHTVAIGILAALHDEAEVGIDSLFSFDSKIYDTGIENKMVIAVPGFSAEAAKFAERQDIRVYNIEELRALLCQQVNSAAEVPGEGIGKGQGSGDIPDFTEIGPSGWLKWLLTSEGYHVDEKAKVVGRSGAEHILDLYAQKDDGIINHRIAAGIIVNESGSGDDVNQVIQFDTATYDARIRDKVIISVPGLSKEAKRFAEYQRIKVLEARELAEFNSELGDENLADRFNAMISKS